jgi:GH35 family endo-1,4-beta-xylanase
MYLMTKPVRLTFYALAILLAITCSGAKPLTTARTPRLAAHTLQSDDWSLARTVEGGFDTVVHVFAWREIEPTRGEFHWEVTDQMVAGAEYYGIDLVVRLDQQPDWAARSGAGFNAPPDDLNDYRRFVEQVASRYQGRIKAYIIWNEPNLAVDWGGLPPDPVAYVELLKAGYEAVKGADPDALALPAGLAPTNHQSDAALDDRLYLRRLYEAGAAPYFDVLAAHPYGFAFPPDAPATQNNGLVMGRLADLREIMVEFGDAAKPVWITEFGWTVNPPPEQPDIEVDLAQQAAYLVDALAHIEREWPWVELVTVWNISRLEADHPFAGYSLFEANGDPRPAFTQLQTVLNRTGQPVSRLKNEDTITILSEDVVIHLGDSNLATPWRPLFAGRYPSLVWTGGFYLNDPGRQDWVLRLEMTQQSDLGAHMSVNGVRLQPDLPQQDFTRRWITSARVAPANILRPGHNEITVNTVSLIPDAHHYDYVWNDFEFRHVRLARE